MIRCTYPVGKDAVLMVARQDEKSRIIHDPTLRIATRVKTRIQDLMPNRRPTRFEQLVSDPVEQMTTPAKQTETQDFINRFFVEAKLLTGAILIYFLNCGPNLAQNVLSPQPLFHDYGSLMEKNTR
jgi:hypothetical protein